MEEVQEVKNVTTTANPAWDSIMIQNPLTKEKAESLDGALSRLPEKERQRFIAEELKPLTECVEVLKIGPDVRRVKVGDFISLKLQDLQMGYGFQDSDVIILPERAIVAFWDKSLIKTNV